MNKEADRILNSMARVVRMASWSGYKELRAEMEALLESMGEPTV